MSDDPSPRAIKMMGRMRHARTLDMPDIVALAAVQALAQVAADNEHRLSPDDLTTLICVGALLSEIADREMKAGIDAFFAIRGSGHPKPRER